MSSRLKRHILQSHISCVVTFDDQTCFPSKLSHSALHINTKRFQYNCPKCEKTIATRKRFLSPLHKYQISKNDQAQNITPDDKNMTAAKLNLPRDEDEDNFSGRAQTKRPIVHLVNCPLCSFTMHSKSLNYHLKKMHHTEFTLSCICVDE